MRQKGTLFYGSAKQRRDSARLERGLNYVSRVNACLVQSYEDSAEGRTLLADFLGRAFGSAGDSVDWCRRFEQWWDLNPAGDLCHEKGWVLKARESGEIVGFLGLIPLCYAVDGKPVPAVVPTTWVVEPAFREASMMLGRKLQEFEGRTLIVSTTGRRDFRDRLVRRGWVLSGAAIRQFLPCGRWARFLIGESLPLREGRRITSEVDDVRSVAESCQSGRGIEKWITPDYLRWYRQSPAREHRFAGVIDSDGRLTSFLMLAPAPVWGVLRAWSVVDWFTTEPGYGELRRLLSAVAESPEKAGLCEASGLSPFFLKLTSMVDDEVWSGVRGLLRAPVSLNHFHRAPESLRFLPKRCVLAEGDLGL